MQQAKMLSVGEIIRWYLRSARHPLKDKIVGRYWGAFSCRPWWIRYGKEDVILVNLRDYLQQRIFFDGVYEPVLIEWLRRELRSTDIFWDVGANIGAMTLMASRCCRTVVAFEPEPRTRDHLSLNIAVNKIDNVMVHGCALSDVDGPVRLARGPRNNCGMSSIVRSASDEGCVSVRGVRADTLVQSQAVPLPNIIKIDVEGAEELVLRGAESILSHPELRAVVFEASEGPDDQPANPSLAILLDRHGFRLRIFGRSDVCLDDGTNNYLATRRLQ